MPRPQFTLRALLVATLLVAGFFGGRELGVRHERQNRLDELVAEQTRIRDELRDTLRACQKLLNEKKEERAYWQEETRKIRNQKLDDAANEVFSKLRAERIKSADHSGQSECGQPLRHQDTWDDPPEIERAFRQASPGYVMPVNEPPRSMGLHR